MESCTFRERLGSRMFVVKEKDIFKKIPEVLVKSMRTEQQRIPHWRDTESQAKWTFRANVGENSCYPKLQDWRGPFEEEERTTITNETAGNSIVTQKNKRKRRRQDKKVQLLPNENALLSDIRFVTMKKNRLDLRSYDITGRHHNRLLQIVMKKSRNILIQRIDDRISQDLRRSQIAFP